MSYFHPHNVQLLVLGRSAAIGVPKRPFHRSKQRTSTSRRRSGELQSVQRFGLRFDVHLLSVSQASSSNVWAITDKLRNGTLLFSPRSLTVLRISPNNFQSADLSRVAASKWNDCKFCFTRPANDWQSLCNQTTIPHAPQRSESGRGAHPSFKTTEPTSGYTTESGQCTISCVAVFRDCYVLWPQTAIWFAYNWWNLTVRFRCIFVTSRHRISATVHGDGRLKRVVPGVRRPLSGYVLYNRLAVRVRDRNRSDRGLATGNVGAAYAFGHVDNISALVPRSVVSADFAPTTFGATAPSYEFKSRLTQICSRIARARA